MKAANGGTSHKERRMDLHKRKTVKLELIAGNEKSTASEKMGDSGSKGKIRYNPLDKPD